MRMKIIVRFMLFAGVVSLIAGCEKPTAQVVNIKMGRVSVQSATLIFDVEVHNPYSVSLPLVGADYALSTEGQKFMDGKADIQSIIPAGESKVVELPVRIGFLELFQTVKGVRGKSEIPYTADLGFFVKPPVLGKLRLPVQRQGTLKLPSKQDLIDRVIPIFEK